MKVPNEMKKLFIVIEPKKCCPSNGQGSEMKFDS